ncbi:MAG: radical SAM protein [Phycisphaerae bacterium]|nr:radical SAM protein [Phycisphaerae bacterium]
MRTLLIFPPPASPTYVPLGLASVTAYSRAQAPADLTVLDLNIATWLLFAQSTPQGSDLTTFVHNPDGAFFDPLVYTRFQTIWATINQQVTRLHQQALHYLETGEWTAPLERVLGRSLEQIRHTSPDLLGFSVMFLDQMAFALAMTRRIHETTSGRKRPYCVLGGAALCAVHVTDLMQHAWFVDAVLPGEGEQALAQLCQGISPSGVSGLITRSFSHGTRQVTPARHIELTSLPVPDFTDLRLTDYANPEPVLPVVLSRHCAWARCRFCAHNHSFASHRQKSVDQFVDELEVLMTRHSCRHFYLADQYVPTDTLITLSKTLLARGLNIKFQIMARPTPDLTGDTLALAASAGCCWISWGVETGSQRLLNLVRKGTRRDHIERILHDSHTVGITNLLMMIFGLPTSTPRDLDQTLDMLGQVYPDADAITASSFVLFEDTPFAKAPDLYDLVVEGKQILLSINSLPIHTTRLTHQTLTLDGLITAPIGPMEIAQWIQRRRWYGSVPFTEHLPCEHLLLYSAQRQAQGSDKPVKPIKPAPQKAA